MFVEAFFSSKFDDMDSSDDYEYSSVYTTSLSMSTSLNFFSTALCLFSVCFLIEIKCG